MKVLTNILPLVLLKLYIALPTKAFSPNHYQCHHSIHTRTSSSTSTTSLNADLITFDLDDTIFPVGPVVQDANKALMEHLNKNGYDKITQETLIGSTKFIRNELMQNENKAITYTELRKRAICFEMNKHHNKENDENEQMEKKDTILFTDVIVTDAYDLWEMNRHLAAEYHLYHDTIDMLKSLKELYPNMIIGAITNGKGNPLHMNQTTNIHEYFDFCISGEDDNVFPYRKPHEMIYLKSLDYYFDMVVKKNKEGAKNSDNLCWVHVGDDLANDVGASAQCGALAIWADLDEEEYSQSASISQKKQDKNNNTSTTATATTNIPFYSTATKEEIEKRKKLNDESLKFVSAKIQRLSDLPAAVKNLVTTRDN